MFQTDFTALVDIRYPIIQAGMAGGLTTPELVAAVSNAGGLGTLGAGYLPPETLGREIDEVSMRTDQPFAVNLFVPSAAEPSPSEIEQMKDYLQPIRSSLGITDVMPQLTAYGPSFEAQMEVVLAKRVPVFSFTFGIPDQSILQALRQQGTIIVGTATTVPEALALVEAQVDAIVVQGSEAGGHRGTFLTDAKRALIGTMALVPQVVDAVSVPVIAAGGIMDGRGLVSSMALGAAGVQMGTAFIACAESGANEQYKHRVLTGRGEETDLTEAYSGKLARGIRTEFMAYMEGYSGPLPQYPIQNALTRDIRSAAAQQNNPEYMSLWAGQGVRLASTRDAGEIVRSCMQEASDVAKALTLLAAEGPIHED